MGSAELSAESVAKPSLALGPRLNLSVMMFLEFAVWGAWYVVLGVFLEKGLKFTATQIGSIYATMSLGAIISPMFIGQIADRYFSSERLMGVLHILGAGLLFGMSQATEFVPFYWITLAYALVYSPTLALSNSITFTHVPDGARDFPGIRVLGTIGWIAANLIVGSYLDEKTNEPLILAACFSAVLGVYSFMLPHTPPAGKAGDALPFLRAVGLIWEPSFAVFFGVSFIITIVLAFYYNFTSLFLTDLKVDKVASVMTIGQWAEMILLPTLPFFLSRFGMKAILAVGMLAWGVRYAIFSVGTPIELVIASLALHGVCFDFFFAAGFIHVENKAPPAIRASGQALFSFLTYGLGMFIGGELSGRVVDYFTTTLTDEAGNVLRDKAGEVLKQHDWHAIWAIPSIGVLVSLVIFVLFFRDRGAARPAETVS